MTQHRPPERKEPAPTRWGLGCECMRGMCAAIAAMMVLAGCGPDPRVVDSTLPPRASSSPMTASPPPTSTSREPSGPVMDEDGVGYKIDDCFLCTKPPGTWETMGKRPESPMRRCTWTRSTDLIGSIDSMIDMGYVEVGQVERVALEVGDYFVTRGCLPWQVDWLDAKKRRPT